MTRALKWCCTLAAICTLGAGSPTPKQTTPPAAGAATEHGEQKTAPSLQFPPWLVLRPGLVCRLGYFGEGEDVLVYESAADVLRAASGGDDESSDAVQPKGTLRPDGIEVRVVEVRALRDTWSQRRRDVPSYAVRIQDVAGTWTGFVSEQGLIPIVPPGVAYWPAQDFFEGTKLCNPDPAAYESHRARCTDLPADSKVVTLQASVSRPREPGVMWLRVRVTSGAKAGRTGWIRATNSVAFGAVDAGHGFKLIGLVYPERDLFCARREIVEAAEAGRPVARCQEGTANESDVRQ